MGYNVNRHAALDHAVSLAEKDYIDSDPASIVEAAEAFHAFLNPKKAKANPAVFGESEGGSFQDPNEFVFYSWSTETVKEAIYRIRRRDIGTDKDNAVDAFYPEEDRETRLNWLSAWFVNDLREVPAGEVPEQFRTDTNAWVFGYGDKTRDALTGVWLLLDDGRATFRDVKDYDGDEFMMSSYSVAELRAVLVGDPGAGLKVLGRTKVPADLTIADHY